MSGTERTERTDVAVVGAGAAGLMAAIQAAAAAAGKDVLLIDTRRKIGAKILISGGTRCNVTNRRVTPSDYNGGPSHLRRYRQPKHWRPALVAVDRAFLAKFREVVAGRESGVRKCYAG